MAVDWNMKLPAHRAGLPGDEVMIIGSAFLPAYKAGHPADLPVAVRDDDFRGTNQQLRSLRSPMRRAIYRPFECDSASSVELRDMGRRMFGMEIGLNGGTPKGDEDPEDNPRPPTLLSQCHRGHPQAEKDDNEDPSLGEKRKVKIT
jgi:hypothetical protein